jgi:putative acetyltransferase
MLIIRNELENEYRTVEELTREAFWNRYVPGCNEHFCLHQLRGTPDFIAELDLVAELNGKLIGHILYTHAKIIDSQGQTHPVACFGPVSILPSLQGRGYGATLIRYSLEKARSLGFKAVFIYGDPRYYHRFGFRCAEKYDITTSEGKYAVGLMALELLPSVLKDISGRFVESPLFQADEDEFQKYEESFPPKEKAVNEGQTEFKILCSLVY